VSIGGMVTHPLHVSSGCLLDATRLASALAKGRPPDLRGRDR
jgi:hypothetical protein